MDDGFVSGEVSGGMGGYGEVLDEVGWKEWVYRSEPQAENREIRSRRSGIGGEDGARWGKETGIGVWPCESWDGAQRENDRGDAEPNPISG